MLIPCPNHPKIRIVKEDETTCFYCRELFSAGFKIELNCPYHGEYVHTCYSKEGYEQQLSTYDFLNDKQFASSYCPYCREETLDKYHRNNGGTVYLGFSHNRTD